MPKEPRRPKPPQPRKSGAETDPAQDATPGADTGADTGADDSPMTEKQAMGRMADLARRLAEVDVDKVFADPDPHPDGEAPWETPWIRCQHLDATAEDIDYAGELLRDGDLVAFPTETVYGLGADASNGTAVAQIYDAKGRPSFNPLIVHVADTDAARRLVQWSDQAEMLAAAFWPGPLTLVLPLRAGHGLSSLVTAGLDTVALRVPAHPTARALLAAFGGTGIAAPSANPSGRISPTRAQHVLAGLGDSIAAVVDDGPCTVGVESTIVALGPDPDTPPRLLRAGGLPSAPIEAALGQPLATDTAPQTKGAPVVAPGQLSSHYAPAAAVRLNATEAAPGEVLLGFGPVAGALTLSASGDLTEAAANLFDCLHQLDAMDRPIAVAPIPETGLGAAINDRLRRAAAPR